jgi:hemerythrin HHE cation binding domain-containing protein
MNAIDFLLQEHANVKEKFAEIENASPDRRGELWKELKPDLKVHEHIEDEFLYGPISRDPKAKGTPAGDYFAEQKEDVAQLEKLFSTLESGDPIGEGWMGTLREINAALMEHVRKEEGEVFPSIRKIWDEAKLTEAGRGMKEEHDRKLSQAGVRE